MNRINSELLYEDVTGKIREACYEVWQQFQGAFKEKVVERALVIALKKQGLRIDLQKRIDIYFDGQKVGSYIPDIIVEDVVLVELKRKLFLVKEDEKQFWLYLKGSQYKVGLLINFGSKRLEIRRRVYDKARQKDAGV